MYQRFKCTGFDKTYFLNKIPDKNKNIPIFYLFIYLLHAYTHIPKSNCDDALCTGDHTDDYLFS